MKKILFLLFFITLSVLGIALIPFSKAQNNNCDIQNIQNMCGGTNGFGSACSDLLSQCESSINQALSDSLKATAPLQSKLDTINSQIKSIKNTVFSIEISLAEKKKDIDQRNKDLAKQKEILNQAVRNYYISSYYNNPLQILLSGSLKNITQVLGYQEAVENQNKATIYNIASMLDQLQKDQKNLETQETNLTALKGNLDQQSAQLDKIVSGAKKYQNTLSNQLSQLNSVQQQILSARLSGLNIPLFAYNTQGGCSSDVGKDPGFSPKFGFFTYGVPNRVGLNQYGAYGRSKAGKGYEEILRAYYNFDEIKKRDANINVQGYQSYSLDEYVKRIYEVPNEWGNNGGMNALRAQAIAARSYALAYTNNGSGSICTTEQCQVFKPDPKGGNWDQAVIDTAGLVMTQGGSPIKAWFSSTHGGYIHSSGDIGWSGTSFTKNAVDTPSGSAGSFSGLQNNAYDKDSPWFYCDWGSRSDYNKTAWLKSDEVADIVNVILLLQNNSDPSIKNHLFQTDKPNPAGTDTWDASRVKQELSKYRNPFNNISNISISADFGSGKSTNVHVTGDASDADISASDFKNYFNLRAPANIQIVGPLYNIER